MDKLVAIFAFVVFLVFVGILIWHVPRLDLMAVVGLTVVLTGWDLARSLHKGE
ncbi:MAG: hypothetical protein Q8K20_00165 [Gemmobacter sp.]|nr:hypothetical protein [Gemmobacter sp.]